jgi:hypothetical protein
MRFKLSVPSLMRDVRRHFGGLVHAPDDDAYRAYIADLNAREMANSTTYDNALLTLSSAFLALSATFIDNIVDLNVANARNWLFGSWLMFVLTIGFVIGSFIYGQYTTSALKEGARRYFIDGDKTEDSRSKVFARRMRHLNSASGVLFLSGILLFILFVLFNVPYGDSVSTKPSAPDTQRGQPITPLSQAPAKPQQSSPPPPQKK